MPVELNFHSLQDYVAVRFSKMLRSENFLNATLICIHVTIPKPSTIFASAEAISLGYSWFVKTAQSAKIYMHASYLFNGLP